MRKLIEFFKRLWRLITGQEVRPYVPIDEPLVISKKKLLNKTYVIDMREQQKLVEQLTFDWAYAIESIIRQ